MASAEEVLRASADATRRERLLIAGAHGEPMADPGDQLSALVDLTSALREAGIPCALIGGLAVGIHSAVPRATMDVDVAVPTSVPRDKVIEVLEAAGFEPSGSFEHSVNLRHSNGEPIQVAWDPAFDPMIDRAGEIQVEGRQVRVVTKEDLIASKQRAAGDPSRRPSKALRDRADVALLQGDVPDPDEGW
jgi:predicted nucleotidyltransferase